MTTQTPTNSHVRVAVSLLGCRQSTFDCLAATSLAVANFCKPIHNNQRDTHSFIQRDQSTTTKEIPIHSFIQRERERSIHNNQSDTHPLIHSERERDQSTTIKEIPIHSFIQRDQSTTIKEIPIHPFRDQFTAIKLVWLCCTGTAGAAALRHSTTVCW